MNRLLIEALQWANRQSTAYLDGVIARLQKGITDEHVVYAKNRDVEAIALKKAFGIRQTSDNKVAARIKVAYDLIEQARK